jgi:hypothetical protein
MGEPGLWSPTDLEVILGHYGAFIVERSGTDMHEALATLRQFEENIWIVRFGNPSDLRYEYHVCSSASPLLTCT